MSKVNFCPECGSNLASQRKRCTCGWHEANQGETKDIDHLCQYVALERRCPLPGTVCPYPYGNGPWYCSEHSQILGDAKKGEAVLIEAEKNLDEILKSKRGFFRNII